MKSLPMRDPGAGVFDFAPPHARPQSRFPKAQVNADLANYDAMVKKYPSSTRCGGLRRCTSGQRLRTPDGIRAVRCGKRGKPEYGVGLKCQVERRRNRGTGRLDHPVQFEPSGAKPPVSGRHLRLPGAALQFSGRMGRGQLHPWRGIEREQ